MLAKLTKSIFDKRYGKFNEIFTFFQTIYRKKNELNTNKNYDKNHRNWSEFTL